MSGPPTPEDAFRFGRVSGTDRFQALCELSQEMTLAEGETFHELPSDIHTVSRNASETEPAKILVFFVKDEGAPPTEPLAPGSR